MKLTWLKNNTERIQFRNLIHKNVKFLITIYLFLTELQNLLDIKELYADHSIAVRKYTRHDEYCYIKEIKEDVVYN